MKLFINQRVRVLWMCRQNLNHFEEVICILPTPCPAAKWSAVIEEQRTYPSILVKACGLNKSVFPHNWHSRRGILLQVATFLVTPKPSGHHHLFDSSSALQVLSNQACFYTEKQMGLSAGCCYFFPCSGSLLILLTRASKLHPKLIVMSCSETVRIASEQLFHILMKQCVTIETFPFRYR